MIFLSSTRTSSLAILYLLVTRSIISSEFVRLFFDSFTDFFLRNHGVLIFNRSAKPSASAMASTAPRISKISSFTENRDILQSILHIPSIFFRFYKIRSIFKSESRLLFLTRRSLKGEYTVGIGFRKLRGKGGERASSSR